MVKFISNKNPDGNATVLFGINIDKFFMPSVANIIGVDLKKYKVVKKHQFACNRMHVGRDERLPISMSIFDYDFIVSPAYDVFEVITSDVLPEYLMLWFRRKEFDRQCWFYTDADVRGGLHLDALKSIEIKVPSIEEQRQIVEQYQSIANKIKVNEQICEKLEATAQALYKHWFVDFEFPNEQGKPYKSSGGKMVWNEELGKDIPEGWEVGRLGNICSVLNGYAFNSEYYSFSDGIKVLRGENVTEKALRWDTLKYFDGEVNTRIEKCFLKANDIVIGMDGSKVGKNWSMVGEYELPMLLAQRVACLRSKGIQYFLYQTLINLNFEYYCSQVHTGTSIPHISTKQIEQFQIIIPTICILDDFEKLMLNLRYLIDNRNNQNQKLTQLQSLLLSRLAVGEEVSA